jgi:DNA-binding LacI/PurR family transcriptional regulator/signal transduction histidine kinase/ActR/RegA family two-component response regulator
MPTSHSLPDTGGRSLGGRVPDARRPKVAVLLDYMSFMDGAYQSRIGEAFHEAATKLEVDLLIFFGRGLEEPNPFSTPHNRIYELIEARSADGVVVVSTLLAAHSGAAGLKRLVERYAGLSVVSLGLELPELPSVVVDHQRAMEELVEHVVVTHGRRRIAFLAGMSENPESEERLTGYRRVLERHGIDFDPALVGYGNSPYGAARATLSKMLDRGPGIDALVAASDRIALGAIDLLQERGLAVPQDVVVTGCDDVWLGRLGELALTTVSQPFERMAEQALSLALKRGDEARHGAVRVAADVIVRRSCGCSLGRPYGERVTSAEPDSPQEHLRRNEARVAALLIGQLGGGPFEASDARMLFEALRAELEGRSGEFLRAVERALSDREGEHDRQRVLHTVIDALREEFRHVARPELEDLWYRALSRVTYGTITAGVERRIALDNEYMRLLSTADRVSVALDLPTLGDAILASLTNVGINTAFISRFATDDDTHTLWPLVSLLDGTRGPALEAPFPAAELVPPDSYTADKRRSLWVFPLVFETQWLGVAVFEYVRGRNGYQMLRDQFAAALGHVRLHQQVLTKTMLHERSVQERQATNRRLEALSVLAGGVAHDLNNTLGPLVALPDIVVEELGRLAPADYEREVLDGVYADIRCMKSAGVRAAQTIKDLLTLGRQGRAPKEALDLNQAVQAGLRDLVVLLQRSRPKLVITLDLEREPLVIRASEAHLTRAITNLLHNAAEAIHDRGEIVVRTSRVHLATPLAGYETILPGDYATVSVSDTGSGIPESAFERVFEPFYSGKRIGEHSGSGLGLAIVHSVAKEHEGFVDLSSRPGHGTTFTLYFPRAEAPNQARPAAPALRRGSARILVVDDDPLQARTARRVLAHLGYQVDVLESGARVLELVNGSDESSQTYDLLLLDVMLDEGHDGIELLRHIRRRHAEQKAIIASGQAPRVDDVPELRAGVTWLTKPYTTEGLAKAIEVALAASGSLAG